MIQQGHRVDDEKMNRLLIVQPYVPGYRVPLFAEMKKKLAARGIELAIAAAEPLDIQRQRGDDHTTVSADYRIRSRQFSIGQRTLLWRDLAPTLQGYDPDLLIVEQAIKNLEAWRPLISHRFGGRTRVAMWGQGRSYSTKQSRVEAGLKQWLTRRASWFFAYTPAGAQYVVSRGFPADRVTVLWNSSDTESLRRDMGSLTSGDVDRFRSAWNLARGKTSLFLGGVDQRKGISFLLESARLVAKAVPGFTLLIAGAGDMSDFVEREAAAGSPVRSLGRIEGREKALALAASDILMIPEWVGLVAVDALTANKLLVTTNHPSHSPEIDYLTLGVNALMTPHDSHAYSQAVIRCLNSQNPVLQEVLTAKASLPDLSIASMAANFVDGIEAWREHLG